MDGDVKVPNMDIDPHKGTDLPVFAEVLAKFENLEFLRDGKGRWTTELPKTGWYQNLRGELFHYDGVVWDEVPSERVSDLEFLG